MLDTVSNYALTALMVVVGPTMLALGLAYGIIKSVSRNGAMKKQTDDAAKRLYREGSEQERKGGEPFSDNYCVGFLSGGDRRADETAYADY